LISVISDAKPKIADYPFTTLEPNLGIVRYKDFRSITVADIPGIIEGAHIGKGLGLKFLRHIERTKILLIMIDITSEDYAGDYKTLLAELNQYSKVLSKKKKILCFTKADLIEKSELTKIKKKKIRGYDGPILIISSAIKSGIPELLDELWNQLSD
ncbi:MAG: GTPase ObgE, partial [Ignavibacteriae bacterium HGW-Ignavibacteriae-3]